MVEQEAQTQNPRAGSRKITDSIEVMSLPPDEHRHEWYYQAECDVCGWHTRQAEGGDGKRWANTVAYLHKQTCPAVSPEGNAMSDQDVRLSVARNAAGFAMFADDGRETFELDGVETITLSAAECAHAEKVAQRVIGHLDEYDQRRV